MTHAEGPLSRFGIYLFPWGKRPPTVEALVELAREAEALGFDSVHVPWHSTLPAGRFDWGNRAVVDPLLVLPAVILGTSRIRVAMDAAPITLQHPYFWAQYLASAEAMARGRFIAGLTKPYWKDDFKTGMAKPGEGPVRFDEALETIRKLWRGEPITARGRFWDARGLELGALPSPDMPVWLASGEPSIERAAKYADAIHTETPGWQEIRDNLRPKLDAAAKAHRRDKLLLAQFNYSVVIEDDDEPEWAARVLAILENRLSWQAPDRLVDETPDESVVVGTSEECAERICRLFEAGVDYFVFDVNFHGWESVDDFGKDQLHRLAERVVPQVAERLAASGMALA